MLLPKPVRERLGLQPGAMLELVETSDGVILKVPDQRTSLQDEGGVLVCKGALPPGFDVFRVIEEDREDRMRGIWQP